MGLRVLTPGSRPGRVLRWSALLLLFGGQLHAQSIQQWLDANCTECAESMPSKTGIYILEKGEEALIGRAWLAQHAERTIDIQYFIWSTDNIGTLAAEQLLLAADRGVRVRVLVDDLLIDAEEKTLLMAAAHPNIEIRIYNPNLSVGVSFLERLANTFSDFREINQRMHDKTAIFDGIAGVTGGRNMADEYFDYDHEYNFRDRDVLLIGQAVSQMSENFEEFWSSTLSVPVEDILFEAAGELSSADVTGYQQMLHAYANNPENFNPQVRQAIDGIQDYFPQLLQAIKWENVTFISDVPGKNSGDAGLGGGGESTRQLITAIRAAKHSILIQSPYLIMPEGGIELFRDLIARGVRIRISTNSLASTDNIPAFSGYHRQRDRLLAAGVELYEFKPNPGIQLELVDRYPSLARNNPIFALHAKSMVIDDKLIFIGTFNLDPRSANLNTEVGVLVKSRELASQLSGSIERDILPENSWRTTTEFSPDSEVSLGKRMHLWFDNLLPMEDIL